VFTYYVDPDGCLVENSIEMTRIDVDSLHQPTHWPIGEGMSGRWINLWGGGPPVGFGDPGLAFARDV
jgi:catechol 2,3-dioxygenase